MYLDNTYLASQEQETKDVVLTGVYYSVNNDGELYLTTNIVAYHVLADSEMAVKPTTWTSPRPAMGEIQIAYSDYLQVRGSLLAKLTEYDNQIYLVNYFYENLQSKLDIRKYNISIVQSNYWDVAGMNSLILVAKTLSFAIKAGMLVETGISDATEQGSPMMLIAGLSEGIDPSFLERMIAAEYHSWANNLYFALSSIKNLSIIATEFAKELLNIQIEIATRHNEKEIGYLDDQAELEREIKKLGVVLNEMLALEEGSQPKLRRLHIQSV